jgi:hypothetical protein
MQLYLRELEMDTLATAILDDIATMLLDIQVFAISNIKNVGRQVIPLIVRDVPDSPFVKSSGIVMLQPGSTLLVETDRVDPAQFRILRDRILVKAGTAAIPVTS